MRKVACFALRSTRLLLSILNTDYIFVCTSAPKIIRYCNQWVFSFRLFLRTLFPFSWQRSCEAAEEVVEKYKLRDEFRSGRRSPLKIISSAVFFFWQPAATQRDAFPLQNAANFFQFISILCGAHNVTECTTCEQRRALHAYTPLYSLLRCAA